jgi:hypothetical protein
MDGIKTVARLRSPGPATRGLCGLRPQIARPTPRNASRSVPGGQPCDRGDRKLTYGSAPYLYDSRAFASFAVSRE